MLGCLTICLQVSNRILIDDGNADCLSRLPLSNQPPDGMSPEPAIFNVSQIASLPVTAAQLQKATRDYPILSKVLRYTANGWPQEVDEAIAPIWRKRQELTIESGCLLWGTRVLVPDKLCAKLLEELHSDHPGIIRMKLVARSYFWWPKLDKNAPVAALLHLWVWPTKPWQRVHLDFTGPFQGLMFFMAVDTHSKWPEVFTMTSTTAEKTIKLLHHLFAAYGIPE